MPGAPGRGAAVASLALVLAALAIAPPAARATQGPDDTPGRGDAAELAFRDHASVTLAFLPAGTDARALAAVPGISPGLMSAGLGRVPADQTYLDIGQGNRVFESLYDRSLPRLFTVGGRVPPVLWRAVVERARGAPAQIEPGLLGGAVARGLNAPGAAAAKPAAGAPGLVAVGRDGRVAEAEGCPLGSCPGMTVASVGLRRLPALVERLRGDDLLIAIERPPPEENGRQLAIGVAGRGFDGQLTSDSTRVRGLVLSTDLAPTVLERLRVEVPGAVAGRPLRTEGAAEPEALVSLEDRIAVVGPRRGPVIGANLLIWALVAGLAATTGTRGARVALRLVAVAGIYLPAVLLFTGAIAPGETAERLIVGLGCPALAAATLAAWRGYAAVAVASAITVLAYAADVVAGSPLTPLSLIGSNPALGVRFFGIGNELEATVAALVPIGVGAGVSAWAQRRRQAPGPGGDASGGGVSPRAAATAFAVAAALGVAFFAPGAFGAAVGAAIVLPVGAAVAAWFVLGGGRRRLALAVAAPIAVLGALIAFDLALGGDAHLTRSVLEAGGADELAEIAERRLRLSAESFARNADSPSLIVCALLIVTGLILRRRIVTWFEGHRAALAGLLGAIVATAVGTLANDSGALLLMIGTGYSSLFVGFAWAIRPPSEAAPPRDVRSRDG